MEVLYDLDEDAAQVCRRLAMPMARAATMGMHPSFVNMMVDLVQERLYNSTTRSAIGELGPWYDVCPIDCSLYAPHRFV